MKTIGGKLGDLKVRAERAQERYEAGEKRLYGSDGSKVYSDDVHNEEVGKLRAERNRELGEVEEMVREERAAASARAENARSADPTEALTAEELARANAKRAFAVDDADALDAAAFGKRLESVLAGGDKGAIFAYWMAGQRKQGQMRERRSTDDAPGRHVSASTPLDGILQKMRERLDGGRTRESIEAAKLVESNAIDVEMLAGSLKYGVRTPAEAYMRRAYGDVGQR